MTKAQGYSEINVCPNCGKALDAMQKKSINSTKSGEPYELKRICTHEKCGVLYENNVKFCKKCGSPVVSMQCSCGEIFHQMEDGSFDRYCPKCGSLNPVEQEKQNVAAELKRKQEEAERQKREAEEARRKQEEKAKQRKKEENHLTWIKSLKVGDKITFGSYPFYEDGSEKPIDWIILDIDANGNALLISDYCLDNVSYHEKYKRITWEYSTIRKWLNNEFYNRAFDENEKVLILTSTIEYVEKGLVFDSKKVSQDKIFLLSIDEAKKYFKNDESRIAYPTPYAKSKNSVNGILYVSGSYVSTDRGDSCWWWLRSPGMHWDDAACVSYAGAVDSLGCDVNYDNCAVRVALKINLNNL